MVILLISISLTAGITDMSHYAQPHSLQCSCPETVDAGIRVRVKQRDWETQVVLETNEVSAQPHSANLTPTFQNTPNAPEAPSE
jgi:hypothetical protein